MYAGATGCEEGEFMHAETWLSLVVSAFLLGYLVYALLRPEKF